MQCSHAGCTEERRGKSKYCPVHRAEARAAWIQKIADSTAEREATRERFAKLHAEAHAAGIAASEAHKPTPMVVTGGAPGQPQQSWYVEGGMCGFAWVNVPGNTKFGAWAKKHLGADRDYPRGLYLRCPLNTQSMSTKEAYCRAYAKVLNAADPTIKAWARSRLD